VLRHRRCPLQECCHTSDFCAACASQLLKLASTTPRSYGCMHRFRHYEPLEQANCFYPRRQHREATAAGFGPGTTAMYMQRTTGGSVGNSLYTTIKYMRGAAGIGLGTTIKYLRGTTSAAANNCLSTTTTPNLSVAAFVENRAPHRGISLGPFVFWARACSLCS
jgi:hypothetical protein